MNDLKRNRLLQEVESLTEELDSVVVNKNLYVGENVERFYLKVEQKVAQINHCRAELGLEPIGVPDEAQRD